MELEIKYPCKVGDFVSLIFEGMDGEKFNKIGEVIRMDHSSIIVDKNAFSWLEVIEVNVIDHEEHDFKQIN